jgi:hypothetical protein
MVVGGEAGGTNDEETRIDLHFQSLHLTNLTFLG